MTLIIKLLLSSQSKEEVLQIFPHVYFLFIQIEFNLDYSEKELKVSYINVV